MNLVEPFLRQVAEHPDMPAIVEPGSDDRHAVTFARLDSASRRAAAMLRDSGLRPGDGVLLLQPMSIDLYTALIAIFRLGLVAIVFDPSAGRAHIERCCADFPPAAFIGSAKAHLLRALSPSIRRIRRKFAIGGFAPLAMPWAKAREFAPHDEVYPCTADTPALLTFTSGSTGLPKAALRTHGLLLAQHQASARSLDLQPGEIDLTTLPVLALANLASGVTCLIPEADMRAPGPVSPGPILEQIARLRPTRTAASPAFVERLAIASLRGNGSFAQLRKIYTGGGPVFPSLLRTLREAAPDAEIVPVYGSTEAEPIAHISTSEIGDDDFAAMASGKGLIAGNPVPEIDARVIQDQWGAPIGPYDGDGFAAIGMPAGQAGEIVVSGPHVLPGYLNARGDEETKFRVEDAVWHRTGDAGHIDTRGRLWLLGRCSARIDDARGVLYPFAVECAAMNQPDVRRAALILHRERRVLIVEPRGSTTVAPSALRTAVAWAEIDDIVVVDRIPVDRRHNAKIDYPALRRLVEK
jgi:acyl-CoA synthetase (AMP-forming)/AMP-acid ligase II